MDDGLLDVARGLNERSTPYKREPEHVYARRVPGQSSRLGARQMTLARRIGREKAYSLQGGAPKIANLVYNSNNYGLWYL